MTSQSDLSAIEPPENAPQPPRTVYRAAVKEAWLINDKAVDPTAFYRRNEKWDPNGITIGEEPYSYRLADPPLKYAIFGIISIDIDCVRAIRVPEAPEVKLDITFDKPPHGNINTGLPFRDKNPKLAEKFARLLADCAQVHEVFDPPRL